MTRKTHLTDPNDDAQTVCGEPTKGRSRTDTRGDATCGDCLDKWDDSGYQSPTPDSIGGNGCIQTDAVTVAPADDKETLTGEALIERKRLAGAGRSQDAGTAFGSKWTAEERDELASLREELGRTKAARKFIEDHPHRSLRGALYQIDHGKLGRS